MEKLTPERLERMIIDAGTNATALAVKIGRDKDYIRDFLNGRKKSLKADDLYKIMELVGARETKAIPITKDPSDGLVVAGSIQAGAWMEAYVAHEDDTELIPVARDPRFPHATQYALRVIGDSMDLEAPEGSFVVCVNFAESGLSQKPGMLVHVERTMNGLSETTLKEIGYENGNLVLIPRSSNPRYEPIYPGSDESADTSIRGVVLSVFQPKTL